jgi:hypothetical protein
MRFLVMSVILACAAGAADAQTAGQAASASPTPANDCRVLAAVLSGNDKGIRGAAVTSLLSPKSYGADCDWSSQGMTVAAPDDRNHWMATFGKPKYSTDRLTAQVEYAAIFPFRGSHSFHCSLTKDGGRWTLAGCSMGIIAD